MGVPGGGPDIGGVGGVNGLFAGKFCFKNGVGVVAVAPPPQEKIGKKNKKKSPPPPKKKSPPPPWPPHTLERKIFIIL